MRAYVLAAAVSITFIGVPYVANAFSTSAEAPKAGDPLPDPSGKEPKVKSKSVIGGSGSQTGGGSVVPSSNVKGSPNANGYKN